MNFWDIDQNRKPIKLSICASSPDYYVMGAGPLLRGNKLDLNWSDIRPRACITSIITARACSRPIRSLDLITDQSEALMAGDPLLITDRDFSITS